MYKNLNFDLPRQLQTVDQKLIIQKPNISIRFIVLIIIFGLISVNFEACNLLATYP